MAHKQEGSHTTRNRPTRCNHHPRFRDKGEMVLMTELSGLGEIGGKTAQSAHRFMTFIVIYWPGNENDSPDGCNNTF